MGYHISARTQKYLPIAFTFQATKVCDGIHGHRGMACRGARSVGLCVNVGRTVPTAESDSPARKPALRSVPICLGVAGALRARGGGGAWHNHATIRA